MKMNFLAASAVAFFMLAYSAAAISGAVALDYELLNEELIPGQETTVFLTFKTTTAIAVRDITYSVTTGPFLSSETKTVNLGALGGSSSQQTSFKVKSSEDATTIISYVNVKATYKDDQGDRETNLNIPVNIRRVPIVQVSLVSYSRGSLEPGSITGLSIMVDNKGDGLARDTQITLNQSAQVFSIIGASGQIFIGDLNAGAQKSVNYTLAINPNADIGVYSVPIQITYKDETKTKSYTSNEAIGMILAGRNKILMLKESQGAITAGGTGTVNVETVNLGNQRVQFTILEFSAPDKISVKPLKVYVGKLDSDDSDTTRLEVSAASDAQPGDYQILATVSYSDMFSNSYAEEKRFEITVSEKDTSVKIGATQITLFAVALFALYTLLKRFRKGRK
ncbi:MAG: hypothetical protein HY517_02145 [Candidatus Aenigmarchaeota archaeon]|nr:hypothetical protein [Candidatus Aenigmarchaeota archaeon]